MANTQPPAPTNPDLTLDGQNRMDLALKGKPLTNPSKLVNKDEVIMSYPELVNYLQTYIPVPPLDASRLPVVTNPPLTIPYGQKAIFPPTPPTRLTFCNKVVLVVGGSKNIGRAIANYLGVRGYRVIATSRCPSAYTASQNPHLCDVPLDVRQQSSVDNFFSTVIKPLNRLDCLILCAGIHWTGPIPGVPASDFKSFMEIKPIGHHRCTTAALPYMRNNPDGRVLCFSSIAGGNSLTNTFLGAYNIANHGLEFLTFQYNMDERTMHALGQISNPVTYITITPGVILATIGSYDVGINTADETKDVTDSLHILLAAIQTNLVPAVYPASGVLQVAEQVHDIISAPQPGFKYFVGDPASTLGGTPLTAITQLSYQLSDDQVLNAIDLAAVPILNSSTVNGLREALLSLYSG